MSHGLDRVKGGSQLQVMHRDKRKHNALLRLLVDGEVGERGLVGLMMRGDHRHRQVRPR